MTYEDFHFFVEPIVHHKRVTHAYASRLHPVANTIIINLRFTQKYAKHYLRMPRSIVKATDVRIEKITL